MKLRRIIFLFSLVFLSACVTRSDNITLIDNSHIVSIETAELQQKLLVHDLVVELVKGRLNLRLIIENVSMDSLNIEYRVYWFSVTDFRVDQVYDRGWESITLNPRDMKVIHFQGWSSTARKYQLMIRPVLLTK